MTQLKELVSKLNYYISNPSKFMVLIHGEVVNKSITEYASTYPDTSPYWIIGEPPSTTYNEDELMQLIDEDVIVIPLDNLFNWRENVAMVSGCN